MKVRCCICDEEIILEIDEYIRIQDDTEDYFCDDCAQAAIEYISELQLRIN
jgi:hypothetical protein